MNQRQIAEMREDVAHVSKNVFFVSILLSKIRVHFNTQDYLSDIMYQEYNAEAVQESEIRIR